MAVQVPSAGASQQFSGLAKKRLHDYQCYRWQSQSNAPRNPGFSSNMRLQISYSPSHDLPQNTLSASPGWKSCEAGSSNGFQKMLVCCGDQSQNATGDRANVPAAESEPTRKSGSFDFEMERN